MPNLQLIAFRESARDQVGRYLESLPEGEFTRLPEDAKPEAYLNAAAWRGQIACGGERVEIVVALPLAFPDVLPNIYLADPTVLIPHMTSTRDSHLCYANPHQAFPAPDRPVQIIEDALRMAGGTISDGLTGTNQADFEREFEAYWEDHETHKWISLIKPGGEPRTISRLALDEKLDDAYSIFGENEDQCRQWLANAKPGTTKLNSYKNLYLPLRLAFRPPFPAKNKDIYSLLNEIDPDALRALCDFLTENKARTSNHVVFSVPVNGHFAFGGWTHSRPPRKKKNEPICKGFRDSKVTGKVQLTKCFPNQQIARARVVRADPARLQARVGSEKNVGMLHKTVLVIGCGSIGCRIANLLALGGVGKLILIDDDTFHLENMARHILPASYLGENKADSLAAFLKTQSPHLEVKAQREDLNKILAEQPELIDKNDLVVAATGNKTLELRLSDFLTNGQEPRPAIYTWTEPQGIAAHAILVVAGRGGCLGCAYEAENDSDLIFRYAVDTRLANEVLLSEEGCGGTFQPFSALAADQAALVAARMALAYLHGEMGASTRWHYLGDLNAARELGLSISPRYKQNAGDELIKASFPRHANCPFCKR